MLPCRTYIRDFRIESGMTQRELGLAVGFGENVAGTKINQYEAGARMLPKETIRKIFEVLKIDEYELAVLIADTALEEFKKTVSDYDYTSSEKVYDRTVDIFCKNAMKSKRGHKIFSKNVNVFTDSTRECEL